MNATWLSDTKGFKPFKMIKSESIGPIIVPLVALFANFFLVHEFFCSSSAYLASESLWSFMFSH